MLRSIQPMLYLAVLCDRGEHDDGYSDSERLELLSSGLARGLRVLYHEYGNAELDRLTALGHTINHDPDFKIDRSCCHWRLSRSCCACSSSLAAASACRGRVALALRLLLPPAPARVVLRLLFVSCCCRRLGNIRRLRAATSAS